MSARGAGPLVLIGGEEFGGGCRELDAELLAASRAKEVVVLPTAAAYERPEHVVAAATAWFEALGATVRVLAVFGRADAEQATVAETVRKARYVHVADGSPLHLRSVLKDSALFDAMLAAWAGGAVLSASGAGATLLCDPMVAPRGSARSSWCRRRPRWWASTPTPRWCSRATPGGSPVPVRSPSIRAECRPRSPPGTPSPACRSD